MNKIAISLLAGMLSPAIYWLSGYDFNERGDDATFCFVWAVFLFVATYTYFSQSSK